MSHSSSALRRTWIRLSYLLPALTGLVLLIFFCVPHVFFMLDGEPHATLSPYTLLCRSWSESQGLREAQSATPAATTFAMLISVVVALSWILMIVYAIVAIAAAVCSTVAFSYGPTDRNANRAKRWLQFFCPNRALLWLSALFPLLPAAFPYILLACYRKYLLYDMSLHFIGPSDLLIASIATVLNLTLMILTLRAQSEEHMDMYRLYKAK